MDKEILMLHGARYAVSKLIEVGSCSFAHKINEKWQTVEFTDIYDYLTEKINEHETGNEEGQYNLDSIYKALDGFHENRKEQIEKAIEYWNGIHGQVTAPKGTFEKMFDEAEEDENEYEI